MKRLFIALLTGTILQSVAPAMADEAKPLFDFADKERWIIRARAITVSPDVSSSISGLNDTVDADEAYTGELDFTYFFTDNVAAELILATTNHDMGTDNGINLGHKWVLPPTLTLQYHFNPEGQWRPYVGAGLGYIIYYGEDSGAVDSIDYDNGISYALQTGLDYGINEHWAINLDVKKLYHNTDVSINGGAITADIDLDPWVIGVGVAYRF